MTRPTVALVVFSTGGAAVTTIVSVASPKLNTGLKPSALRASTLRLSWRSVLNPFADTSKVYTPTGNGVMEYAPAPVVVRIVATPVAVLVAVTVALGIEAPV